MIVTINVTVLLAAIIYFRVRRTVHARSRTDQWLTVIIVTAFGVLLAPTEAGQWLARTIGELASAITNM